MSFIQDTKRELNLNKVPGRIVLYEQLIDAAEVCFELQGRNLEEACKTHAKDLMTYDQMLQECKTIEEAIKAKVEEIESDLYRQINETSQRALGPREIQQYIKSEPRYVNALEVLMEVQHTKRRLESIVEALKSMGWSLGHIVKLRIAQLQDTVL
jgi:hypothetical protein